MNKLKYVNIILCIIVVLQGCFLLKIEHGTQILKINSNKKKNEGHYLSIKKSLEAQFNIPVEGDILTFSRNNFNFINKFNPEWKKKFEERLLAQGYDEIVKEYDPVHYLMIHSPDQLAHMIKIKVRLARMNPYYEDIYIYRINAENGEIIKNVDATMSALHE